MKPTRPHNRFHPYFSIIHFFTQKVNTYKNRPQCYIYTMFNYQFQIDKEACFYEWLFGLVPKSWEKTKSEFYKNLSGREWTVAETTALEKLGLFLSPKTIFQKEAIKNKICLSDDSELKNQEILSAVAKALYPLFDEIWLKEYPKLSYWKSALEKYNFNRINTEFLPKIQNFFDVKNMDSTAIIVKLFFGYNTKQCGGFAQKEISDRVGLNISNLGPDKIESAVSTLIHEVSHLIQFQSHQSKMLIKDFIKINLFKLLLGALLRKLKFTRKPFNIPWFTRETIMRSMVENPLLWESYYQRKYFPISQRAIEYRKKLETYDYKNYRGKFNDLTNFAALKILDTTRDYLENNKKIDTKYSKIVAQAWRELLNRLTI